MLHIGWREIADLARTRAVPANDGFESRMLDRVGLLSARLAQAGGSVDVDAIDAVRDLRVGLNIVELQRARSVLGTGRSTGAPPLRSESASLIALAPSRCERTARRPCR